MNLPSGAVGVVGGAVGAVGAAGAAGTAGTAGAAGVGVTNDAIMGKLAELDKKVSSSQGLTEADAELLRGILSEGDGEAPKNQVPDKPVDYESLSKRQLVESMLSLMEKEMGRMQTAFDEKLGVIQGDLSARDVLADIKNIREIHGSNFDLVKEDMIKIAKQYPNLSAQHVYTLAAAQKDPRLLIPTKQTPVATKGGIDTSSLVQGLQGSHKEVAREILKRMRPEE